MKLARILVSLHPESEVSSFIQVILTEKQSNKSDVLWRGAVSMPHLRRREFCFGFFFSVLRKLQNKSTKAPGISRFSQY